MFQVDEGARANCRGGAWAILRCQARSQSRVVLDYWAGDPGCLWRLLFLVSSAATTRPAVNPLAHAPAWPGLFFWTAECYWTEVDVPKVPVQSASQSGHQVITQYSIRAVLSFGTAPAHHALRGSLACFETKYGNSHGARPDYGVDPGTNPPRIPRQSLTG